MSGTLLHRSVNVFGKIVFIPIMYFKYRYKFEKVNYRKGNFIALANHTTSYDSILVGMAFKQHMYFVAGEQLFRLGLVTKLLKTFLAPIGRMKARTESRTAVDMLRTLKAGNNICMFPEGTCTWSGETAEVIQSTAKLIKKAGVALITYRVTGGYPSLPRWSKNPRRGRIEGKLAHIYTPEKLESMSVDDVYKVICEDLYVNANDISAEVEFKGKDLAENLETVLFACPKCHGISTLSSEGDVLSCKCGFKVKYDTHCRLHEMTGKGFSFKTVLEWDRWQRKWAKDHIAGLSGDINEVITQDEGQRLYSFTASDKTTLINSGTLTLYYDRLVVHNVENSTDTVIMLKDITDMAIITRSTISFSCLDKHYEIKCDNLRSALKYVMFCSNLKDMRVII
jgi:1-acyl-sn-glycerol-3-phosphate acyltransferase